MGPTSPILPATRWYSAVIDDARGRCRPSRLACREEICSSVREGLDTRFHSCALIGVLGTAGLPRSLLKLLRQESYGKPVWDARAGRRQPASASSCGLMQRPINSLLPPCQPHRIVDLDCMKDSLPAVIMEANSSKSMRPLPARSAAP